MLNPTIRRKLESLNSLPTIPYIITQVLNIVDNTEISANQLASVIEKDQSLAAKVLAVANSPFYGFSRKIATIDLAVVVLGLNTIKEIVLSLAIQKFFANVRKDLFDVNAFWQYSVFCGAAARVLARKIGYRLVGEAFVAGLMHDIGILIIVQYFSQKFKEIKKIKELRGLSFVEAENAVIYSDHSDIGSWIVEKWQLPSKLAEAIRFHHKSFAEVKEIIFKRESDDNTDNDSNPNSDRQSSSDMPNKDIDQPLALLVAMSEWFANEMGFKAWAKEDKTSELYLANDIINDIKEHDLLSPESAFELLKKEITTEFEKASVLNTMIAKPIYK
jgi:HD-like signal output (HDOD) protein